ncbi:MAG: hypothetical protein Tsb0020_21180 [Haliangiales bacterium]
MQSEYAAEKRREYEENGFTIFRNVIDPDLLAEANRHLEFLAQRFPDLRPEHYHHPLMRDDAFWVRLTTDPRLLDIAEIFIGPDIACFTSHYICKPPNTGQAVLPHQDGAYWKLDTMNAVTLWLAVDASTPENGCLKMYPSTTRLPLQTPKIRDDIPNMLYSEVALELDEEEAVDIVLNPGDVSVHNPLIVHGSKPNTSDKRRCGLDMAFIPTTTRVLAKGVYMNPLLVRGEAVDGVNQYRLWPEYNPSTSMPFAGCETWNAEIVERNRALARTNARSSVEPSVLELTEHMISRLRDGSTTA